MGSSGSGKTTLMNILGCLDRPTSGTYLFAGEDVAGFDRDRLADLRSRSFGFVFPQHNLLANAHAAANVEGPAIYAGQPSAARPSPPPEPTTRVRRRHHLVPTPTTQTGGHH